MRFIPCQASKESEAANNNPVFENIRTDKRVSSGRISLTVNMLEMSKKDSARDRDRRILSPEGKAEEGTDRAFHGFISKTLLYMANLGYPNSDH